MKSALFTGAAILMAVTSTAFAQSQVPSSQAPAAVTQPPAGIPISPLGSTKSGTMNSPDSGQAGRDANAGGMFMNVPEQSDLSSKVVGLSVHNSENADLGTIKDIAFDANGVKAYILAVGGFMGLGDHYVAVRPSAIVISFDAASNKWQAVMNTDADALKAAPAFQYASNG
jgi:hypothetical protein